jgi:hypothetical protein
MIQHHAIDQEVIAARTGADRAVVAQIGAAITWRWTNSSTSEPAATRIRFRQATGRIRCWASRSACGAGTVLEPGLMVRGTATSLTVFQSVPFDITI